MSDLSVKVNIGSRSYPLSVKPEEEEKARIAAKMINDYIKNLEENYAVKDKQDLLAMTAFEFASRLLDNKQEILNNAQSLNQLLSIDRLLDDCLSGK